jgi:hypothetical protein
MLDLKHSAVLAAVSFCCPAGDLNVPAGEVTWRAQAAPLPQPWEEKEQRLLQLRPPLVAAAAAAAYSLAESEAADDAAGGNDLYYALC